MREYLRDLRAERGFSQQYVADWLGITKQYYGAIELGKKLKKIDLDTLTKLSRLYAVTIEWLAEQENKLRKE